MPTTVDTVVWTENARNRWSVTVALRPSCNLPLSLRLIRVRCLSVTQLL